MKSYTVYLDRWCRNYRRQTVRVSVEAMSLDVALAEARAQKPNYPDISMFWLNWEPKR
jgi:hypothetical protein